MTILAAFAAGSLTGAILAWWRDAVVFHRRRYEYREQQSAWVAAQLQRSLEKQRAVCAYPHVQVTTIQNGIVEYSELGLN